jgi:hypothetical protein
MVYAVQNYKVYFGLYPSSGIYKTKNHNVSETGSISVLRWMGQDRPTQLGPLERASLSCPIHVRTETDPVSETLCFFLSYNTRRWMESIINLIVLYSLHHRQNPFKFILLFYLSFFPFGRRFGEENTLSFYCMDFSFVSSVTPVL